MFYDAYDFNQDLSGVSYFSVQSSYFEYNATKSIHEKNATN